MRPKCPSWLVMWCACWSQTALADEPAITLPQLTEQVTLNYPEEALELGLTGDVQVKVFIDTEGLVTHVEILEAPSVFAQESAHAAKGLRFEPATRDGTPVPSTMIVHFHFKPPTPEPPTTPHDDVVEILVESRSEDRDDTHARVTLDEAALDAASGQDLTETMTAVAGVTAAGGTADTTKPIIRGQTERRLLLLNDGIRHESQKWGPDHAPEIDPFAAGEISVIKGAAGVRYGPDAIGGVVLVSPPPMLDQPGVRGKVLLSGSSNAWRPYGGLRLDMSPAAAPALSLRVEGNFAQGTSRRTPDYVLGNTASQVWNLGVAAQIKDERKSLRVSYRHHELKAGIFFGLRLATPDEFLSQLEAGRPATADLWKQNFAIERAYQQVSHDLASLHGAISTGDFGKLKVTYAYQHNHRLEFDRARQAVEGPQYDFTLRTHSLDVLWEHHAHVGFQGFLEGGVGAQLGFQENVYRGRPLLPNHRALGGGVFVWERLSWDRAALVMGARYDGISRNVFMGDYDYEAHQRRGTLDADDCDFDGEVAECPRAWNTGSVSLGTVVQALPDQLEIKLDLSSASRFPNPDELYLLGSAPSFPVYGVGAPDLGVETSWGGSVTVGVRDPWFEAEVSSFGSYSGNYVYFAPELNDAGEPRFDVTIRGAYPTWAYSPIPAVFYGLEATASIAPEYRIGLNFQGALVRGQHTETGDHLVGVPPDRARFTLVGRPPDVGPMFDPFLEVSTELVAKQFLVDPSVDIAAPPDGYVLFGARVGAQFDVGRTTMQASIEAHNMTNVRYRSYTSLLRYYADEPGVDVRARWGLTF